MRTRARFIWRTRFVLSLFCILAAVLLVRLYFVQVIHGSSYRDEAQGQYVASAATIEDRGTIFFTTKDGVITEAAAMKSGYTLAIVPDELEENQGGPAAVYDAINAIIPLDKERFMASAAKAGDPYEEVATRIDETAGDTIDALGLSGLRLVRDRWRFYPAKELAANVLGFVGYQGETRSGRYGLERYWNDTLARSEDSLYVNFFAEMFSSARSLVDSDGAPSRGDIATSIEPTVQRELENVLADIQEAYRPREIGGIIMDPNTGAIVAMASVPTFDPNTYWAAPSAAVFPNPLVESRYELGSIMKPLSMAAGLDAGVVTPSTVYNDPGCIKKSGYTLCNYDHRARGPDTSMQEVLNQSLNTGVSFVADKLGHERFAQYFKSFGLGEETGIDVPNEIRGQIDALDSVADVDYAAASFGQGIAITPIAMIRALSALSNGGVLVEPRVVSRVRDASGVGIWKNIWNDNTVRVLKPETSETISRMLSQVYDDALLDGELRMDHYTLAAKTGTAQIASPQGGYYADRYLHSFFGYFPAYDSRFIIFLYALDPQGEQYASHTLARPFAQLAKFLINYYDIPPDR